MDNMHLVTGFLGREHIMAVDQAALNAALIGTGQFVLDKGKVFEAQVISNNQVRVLDGELMMQGRFVRLNPDTYVDLTIENGAQGMKRNDLIVARYTKDTASGVEGVNLVVIKGDAAASDPADPAHTEGDITNGASVLHDFPLWRIPLDGLNVGEPVALFGEPFMDSMLTLPGIRKSVETIHSKVYDHLSRVDKYNEYWWSLLHGSSYMYYTEGRTLNTSTTRVADKNGTGTVQWAESISIDQSAGTVSLVDPQTMTFSSHDNKATNAKNLEALRGKYISNFYIGSDTYPSSDSVAFVPSDASYYAAEEYSGYSSFTANSCHLITADVVNVAAGEITYEHSTDRNAYPDSGTKNGVTYTYLGIPFENAITAPEITTGSYTGTGKYGSSNPNCLTFDFEPKAVLVIKSEPTNTTGTYSIMWVYNSPYMGPGGHTHTTSDYEANTASLSGTTLSWYNSESPDSQANLSGKTYCYFAIG